MVFNAIHGVDPKDPGKRASNYSNRSEWHATIGFGFDLRRIGEFR
jgi:hypothetical protein